MGKLFVAACAVIGWVAIFFVTICLLPALIPFAPFIAFVFAVWLVWKIMKGV